MYTTKTLFLPTGHPNRPGTRLSKVTGVVVHWTANMKAGANAIGNRNYFARKYTWQGEDAFEENGNPFTWASAHLVIDDTTLAEALPWRKGVAEMGYHVGATNYNQATLKMLGTTYPNDCTIGLEICVNSDSPFGKIYENAIEVTAAMLKEHGLGIDRLIRHYDVTGKDCPAFFVRDDYANQFIGTTAAKAWQDFRTAVQAKLSGAQAPAPKPVPTYPVMKTLINGASINGYESGIAVDGTMNLVWTALKVLGVTDYSIHVDTGNFIVKGKEVKGTMHNGDTYLPWDQLGVELTPEMICDTYTVQKGDTLYGIQTKTGVPVATIKGLNGLTSDIISVGQVLKTIHVGWNFKTKQVEPAPQPEAPKNPIMGESKYTMAEMTAFVKAKNADINEAILSSIAMSFLVAGKIYGIRGDVAFCQSVIETGWFKFDNGTAVTLDQNNFCGLGVHNRGEKGFSFDTIMQGVLAQFQHLYAYATKNPLPAGESVIDPKFSAVYGVPERHGMAPNWEDLNNKWAMNNTYGQHIMTIYQELLQVKVPEKPPVQEPAPDTKPPVQEPVKQEPPVETPKQEEEKVNVSLLNKLMQLVFDLLRDLFFKKK